MVKPADSRNRDHLAAIWRLDGTSIWAVFVERQMGARVVIVVGVRDQNPAEVPLVNHDYMVKTLAANRADDALDVGILPWRSWRRNDLCDPHDPSPLPKGFCVRLVAVAQQVERRCVPRKCLCDLAGEPTGGGVPRDVQMQNLPPRVAEEDAHVRQTNPAVTTTNMSMAAMPSTGLLRKSARLVRAEHATRPCVFLQLPG